jgi:hypothetical protein
MGMYLWFTGLFFIFTTLFEKQVSVMIFRSGSDYRSASQV